MGEDYGWQRRYGAAYPTSFPSPEPDPPGTLHRKRVRLVQERLKLEGWRTIDTAKWKYIVRKAETVREVEALDDETVATELMMYELGKGA